MKYLLLISCMVFGITSCTQKNHPIVASCEFVNKNDTNKIRIYIKNTSSDTLFYTIGLSLLTKSKWKIVLGNINSLNQNEWLTLIPIHPQEEVIQIILKRDIQRHFIYMDYEKVRFFLSVYEERKWDANSSVILLPPDGI